ncbi:hypothetical protein [Lacinutrix salivirga]
MNIRLLTIIIILLVSNLYAQDVFVPYRVGDQFGVANYEGKLVVNPQFDILQLATTFSFNKDKNYSYLVGYKIINDSTNLSSFITNDKIILKDKTYNDYYFDNEVIHAMKYTYSNKKDKWGSHYIQTSTLYTDEGKPVFDGEFKDFNTTTIINDDDTSNEFLITAMNSKNEFTLSLYNKTLKKVTTTYFTNTTYLKYHENVDYNEKAFTYKDEKGQGHKLYFSYNDKKEVVLKSDKLVTLKERKDYYSDDYNDVMEVPNFDDDKNNEVALNLNDSIALKITKIDIKRFGYVLAKKVQRLEYGVKKLNQSFSYVFIENGKLGVKKGRDNTVTIPAIYDQIYYGAFNGYILKKDNKYGLYAFAFKNPVLIEAKFTMLPYLERKNYKKEGFHLIKLFDDNGKLFCYANQDGTLYYSEK